MIILFTVRNQWKIFQLIQSPIRLGQFGIVAAAFFFGIANLFADEVQVFTKVQNDYRFIGNSIPISKADIETEREWVKANPGKTGAYLINDTEMFVEWAKRGQPPQRIWNRKFRIHNLPPSLSVRSRFGRKEVQILDAVFDEKWSRGIVVFWWIGWIWVDAVTIDAEKRWKVTTDSGDFPLVQETDKKLELAEPTVDAATGVVRVTLGFHGGTTGRFRLESGKWVEEKPDAKKPME